MLRNEFKKISSNTYTATIYIAGDYKDVCRVIQSCFSKKGGCVSVDKTTYVYSGGREDGVAIRFINYPRFEKTDQEIFAEAIAMAERVCIKTGQGSFTVVADDKTNFFSRRAEE